MPLKFTRRDHPIRGMSLHMAESGDLLYSIVYDGMSAATPFISAVRFGKRGNQVEIGRTRSFDHAADVCSAHVARIILSSGGRAA